VIESGRRRAVLPLIVGPKNADNTGSFAAAIFLRLHKYGIELPKLGACILNIVAFSRGSL